MGIHTRNVEEPVQHYSSTPSPSSTLKSRMLLPFTSTSGPSCRGHPPNLIASFQESQHFLLLLAWILEQCHTSSNERSKDSLGPLVPCLLSPLSYLRALLGLMRNPIWPSTWENDMQGWGPQASVQAIPINIKQRGCPRVLPRHILNLGQALGLVWCQSSESPPLRDRLSPPTQPLGSSREGESKNCSIQMGCPKEPGLSSTLPEEHGVDPKVGNCWI